jgi:hypothetical protein
MSARSPPLGAGLDRVEVSRFVMGASQDLLELTSLAADIIVPRRWHSKNGLAWMRQGPPRGCVHPLLRGPQAPRGDRLGENAVRARSRPPVATWLRDLRPVCGRSWRLRAFTHGLPKGKNRRAVLVRGAVEARPVRERGSSTRGRAARWPARAPDPLNVGHARPPPRHPWRMPVRDDRQRRGLGCPREPTRP